MDFVLRLVGEPSPSGDEGKVAGLVREQMRSLGFDVSVDDLGNVVGVLDAGPGPCVLLDSHMDTVGVNDPSAWSRNPRGELDGGRIYGRGTMDMKGPLAASIFGAAKLRDQLSRGRVVVAATIAEELVEGPALEKVATAVHPEVVVICEATALKLAIGQRGRAEINVEVTGRATHSSRPELGVNAAEAMTDLINAFRALDTPVHPALGKGILVLTDIKSEPYPGLSVVPDRCVATFDRRTLPDETDATVLAPIVTAAEEAVADLGAKVRVSIAEDFFTSYSGVEVHAPNFAPAWYVAPTDPVVQLALSGLRSAGLAGETTSYAFCTNGSGSARLGLRTLGFGPGNEELAHRADESIEVSELEAAVTGYAGLIQAIVEG